MAKLFCLWWQLIVFMENYCIVMIDLFELRRRLELIRGRLKPRARILINEAHSYTEEQVKYFASIKNLTFCGGGGQTWVLHSVLAYLEEKLNVKIHNLHRVAGTSAGAITALTVSLGLTSEKRDQIVQRVNGEGLKDYSWWNILTLPWSWSLCKGDALENWLISVIKEETGLQDPTFAELRDYFISREDKPPQLYVMATNLRFFNRYRDIFSAEHTPEVKVAKAVRASCAVPLLFPPVKIDGCYYVDGAVGGHNNPVDIFDDTRYSSDTRVSRQASRSWHNIETLGLEMLDETQRSRWQLSSGYRQDKYGLLSFISDIITRLLKAVTFKMDVSEQSRLLTVRPNGDFMRFGWKDADWRQSRDTAEQDVASFVPMVRGTAAKMAVGAEIRRARDGWLPQYANMRSSTRTNVGSLNAGQQGLYMGGCAVGDLPPIGYMF